jgi:ATP-binding cassette, subfamily B, bacterial
VTAPIDPSALTWPMDQIGEALISLARHSGLIATAAPAPRHPPEEPTSLDRWLVAAGEQIGVMVDPVTATNRDADAALASMSPAIVRLPAGALVIVGQRRGALWCLARDGAVRRTPRRAVAKLLQSGHEAPHLARISGLLAKTALSPAACARAEAGMLGELLSSTRVLSGWMLRLPPGAAFGRQVRSAGLARVAAILIGAHAAQYVLFLLSWWAIGAAVLEGHLAPGWLWGWALILLGAIPFVMLSTWCQGKLAVGLGMLLRRRLLAGALQLPPRVINREGIGQLLGRTIEADSLERLALSGGFASALALLELAFAVPVLAAGAGGWVHAGLLGGWLALGGVLGVRLARGRVRWTDQRLVLTGLTVERIVGHRTRLAQEPPERWHDGEDEALSGYLDRSEALDRRTLALIALLPRGWLIAGLCALAPAFIHGANAVAIGTGVGGVVLAWQSFAKLTGGVDQLATARVAWQRVAPLFHAAAGRFPDELPEAARGPRPRPTAPEYLVSAPATGTELVLEAVDLAYRHPGRASDVLSGCNLVIRRGDRVLLQGPSGSGKSTLAALLMGMQTPSRGLLLARGLDMSCLGELGWRSRVAAAPQFHENHVLTESFAFNLLMGRSWPPRSEELEEARTVCEELGLGPLLERMPAGMYQTVGETGWQLSHGEKSRLFIARALLQHSDVVILDESLAALDPENMAAALRCMRARAPALIVIAHP